MDPCPAQGQEQLPVSLTSFTFRLTTISSMRHLAYVQHQHQQSSSDLQARPNQTHFNATMLSDRYPQKQIRPFHSIFMYGT
jgi:hypothetical protein